MKALVAVLMVMTVSIAARADLGKLSGRDAVALGDFLTQQKVVDDMHYGAHPIDAVSFFKAAFDPASCMSDKTPFKSWSLQIKTGQLYCYQSDRFNADIGCTLEDNKKTKKVVLKGLAAYQAAEFLRKAAIAPGKTPTGTSISAGVIDCVYEGVQNCLGNTEKGAHCKFL